MKHWDILYRAGLTQMLDWTTAVDYTVQDYVYGSPVMQK